MKCAGSRWKEQNRFALEAECEKLQTFSSQFAEIQSKAPFVPSGRREKINQNKIAAIWQTLPRNRTSLRASEF